MVKRGIKIIIALFIFMMINKVYAYNYKLVIDNNVNNSLFLHLDETDKAKLKVNVINSLTYNEINVSDIKFKIKNKDTNEYICVEDDCIYETDENGSFITANYLDNGNYQLEQVEEQDLTNYLWNSVPLEFIISDENDYIYIDNEPVLEINFKMKEAKGGLIINLMGERYYIQENHFVYEEYPLSSAKFNLYANDDIYAADGSLIYSKDQLINEYNMTSNNFRIVDLYLGSYYLVQKKSSLENVFSSEPYEFTIEYQDKYTEYAIENITIRNHIPKGSAVIINLDNQELKPISNTRIEVYTDKNELVYSGLTNEEGKLIVNDLALLKYYYKEAPVAAGYIPSDEKVFFSIMLDTQKVTTRIYNNIITGSFYLTKTDYTTGLPVPNALIGIYNENDELIYQKRTDSDGMIRIGFINYGRYYYKEIEAPEGYELNTEKYYFEITTNGEIVEGNMTNEKIEVPNTNKDESYLWLVGSLVLIISGGYLILNEGKKH